MSAVPKSGRMNGVAGREVATLNVEEKGIESLSTARLKWYGIDRKTEDSLPMRSSGKKHGVKARHGVPRLRLKMDFHGQRLVEIISNSLLIGFSAIALLVGFVKQDIHLSLWIGLAGFVLTLLVVVPPWPIFNQHPEPWLGSKAALLGAGIVVGGQKIQ
ncbi:hypothetical protein DV738_g900, partial [Chaetothyriales sp. CBS 135597]